MKWALNIFLITVLLAMVWPGRLEAVGQLKVATYNIGGRRSYTSAELDNLANFIKDKDLDVVFLQEVRSSDTQIRPGVYMDRLNNKLADLGKTYYVWTEDRMANFYSSQGFIGQSIFSKFPFEVNTKEVTVVNGSGVPSSLSDPNIKDLLMKAKIKVNSQEVYLFNYHPQPGVGCNAAVLERAKTKVGEVIGSPIIWAGDFNMQKENCSLVYDGLTLPSSSSLGLKDACQGMSCGQTSGEASPIDYIFYSNSVGFFKTHIGTTVVNSMSLSDHFPVTTSLLLGVVGDATGDGRVDQADFNIWKSERFDQNGNLKQTSTGLRADFDDNSRVDNLDYEIWLAEYRNR